MPITQKTTLAQMIKDFIESDDPKFTGDSKEQRRKRAIGAYYSMHKESTIVEESFLPLDHPMHPKKTMKALLDKLDKMSGKPMKIKKKKK